MLRPKYLTTRLVPQLILFSAQRTILITRSLSVLYCTFQHQTKTWQKIEAPHATATIVSLLFRLLGRICGSCNTRSPLHTSRHNNNQLFTVAHSLADNDSNNHNSDGGRDCDTFWTHRDLFPQYVTVTRLSADTFFIHIRRRYFLLFFASYFSFCRFWFLICFC